MNQKLQTLLMQAPILLVTKDAAGTYVDWAAAGRPPELKPESVWSVTDQPDLPTSEVEVLEEKVDGAAEVVQSLEIEVAELEAAHAEALTGPSELADDMCWRDNIVLGAEARLQATRNLLRQAERECQESQYLLRQARARAAAVEVK